MWASLFNAVTQFATAVTVLFGAFEKVAKAADHIAGVAEDSAGLLADESRFKRELRRRELLAQQTAQAVAMAAAPSLPTPATAQP